MEEEKCENLFGGNTLECSELFNCCDCGGNDCGCSYCWSCNACETCINDESD